MHEPGSRETAVVDDGPVRFVCGGASHDLDAGDAVTFDADLPHHFENPGRGRGALLRRRRRRPEEELTPMPKTLFDKIWEAHEVAEGLLYIDLHLVHEVTSPQAFESPAAGRTRRCAAPTARSRPPTTTCRPTARRRPPRSATSSRACRSRRSSATARSSACRSTRSAPPRQGIVHVIGPELGVTQPGMTIVCGDSHTSTHGAFGALAFGIGTSEVEHVLATQTLQQRKPKSMRIRYEGELGYGVTAKDLILGTIGQIGVAGGVGHVIEYAGPRDRGALDGGPHDRLQHDDRGRRPRGDDRPRRDDLRVGRGPRAPRRTRCRSTSGGRCAPTRAPASTPRW